MAVDKDKLQEEASIVRFCKIILGWDYFRLLKLSKVRFSLIFRIKISMCVFFVF